MAENFLTYEEVDTSERLTVTGTRVTWTDLAISEDAKVYFDKGVNFFHGDFTHYLTVLLTSGSAVDAEAYCWALTNTVALMRAIDLANGDYLSAYVYQGSTSQSLILEECDGGTLYLSGYPINYGTPYYLKIVRDEAVGLYGTLYCYIYDDAERTNLVDTLTRTLHSSTKDFRYIFALNNLGAGTTQKTSGYMENLSLVAIGYPEVTTQLCTDIKHNSGTGHGFLEDIGDFGVSQHGHCWSEAHNPTTADSHTENGGIGWGPFTSEITGLNPSTLYYVRAYATSQVGTAYGVEVKLTTFAAGAPTITTQLCTGIQSETATGNGNLTDIGDSAVTQHGHVWATTVNPTTADFKTTLGARDVGVFESSLTGLDPDETYYVRAYATNTQGTSYGDNVTLVCPTADIPTVTTQACSAIGPESATGHGNITSFGDDAPSQHGHCWSTSQYPTLTDPHTNNGIPGAPGAFTSAITELVPDSRYYIRAYATNDYGTAYGNQVSIFTYPGGAIINPANPVAVDWADDGVFVDISPYVMEEYIEWGKDRELNEATPSLLSLTLDNFDHRFSPPNASSPYNAGENSVRAGHRITVSFGYPFDDFDDVDGVNIVNHVVPKDSQFAWTEESGTFSVYDGKLRETGGSGGTAVIDFGEAEAHIQVDFTKGANNDCIIVFRYSDTSNYLYVKTDGTNIEIRKKSTAGGDEQVATAVLAWANDATKSVKVILHGAYIYLVVEGSLVISTSSTHNQTETEHGVGGPIISTNARYDDFGGIYSLFYGTIDRVIPYPHKERQTALIEASDDLKILERHILYRRAYGYGAGGGIKEFIREVYKNTANVSQLGEIMDTGETVDRDPYKSWWGIRGLRVCRNVEREENGFFYQDQDSFWNFEAKDHKTKDGSPHLTPRCIFYQDYDTNKLAFTGFKWVSGEEDVINMVSVHVSKAVRGPINPFGAAGVDGGYVWRCEEADVVDGGIASSELEIPATSSKEIYFETSEYDTIANVINPVEASGVYALGGGVVVDGPFRNALTGSPVPDNLTASISGVTLVLFALRAGNLIVGALSGALNAADEFLGLTNAKLKSYQEATGTINGGPFTIGELVNFAPSGVTGYVISQTTNSITVGQTSGTILAGDTGTGATSAATINGTLTLKDNRITQTLVKDYMANAAADGTGADKTGNLTVSLSYPVYTSYGKGGKLTLTNNDDAPIFVTRLTVRGRGWLLKDRGSVYVEDPSSKTTYGEHSFDVQAEILTSLAEAKVLADDLKSKGISPRAKVAMTITNANKEMLTKILSLKLSDRITGNYSDMGINEDFFIDKIIYNITQGGLVVDAVLKLEEVS